MYFSIFYKQNVGIIHKNNKSYIFFKAKELPFAPKDNYSKFNSADGERLGYLIHDHETNELSPYVFDFNIPGSSSKEIKRVMTFYFGDPKNPQIVGYSPNKKFSSDKTAYVITVD